MGLKVLESSRVPSAKNGILIRFPPIAIVFQVVLLLVWIEGTNAISKGSWVHLEVDNEHGEKHVLSHSCIHDEILQQRRRPGRKEYSVSPQVYSTPGLLSLNHRRGRALLELSSSFDFEKDARQPIRIFLNYDAVGHSQDRDCRDVGDIVKLGEPPATSIPGSPACNPHGDPPLFGDCWYNCTLDDIAVVDKKLRLLIWGPLNEEKERRALSILGMIYAVAC